MKTLAKYTIAALLALGCQHAWAQSSDEITADTISVEPVEAAQYANEEHIYDNELDSLRNAVAQLQQQQQQRQQDDESQAIWNGRKKYFNFYYAVQSLSQDDIGATWRGNGAAIAMGRTFYFPKKPIAGMIKFGIDWSYFDINVAQYTDHWGVFSGGEYAGLDGNYYYEDEFNEGRFWLSEDVLQAEIGMAIGPSVTINPIDHLKASLYFHVVPSFAMLYAAEGFGCSYGTFFKWGGSVAYKVISVGLEARWGKAKYGNVIDDYEDLDEETTLDGAQKWKTGSLRVFIGFRF